MEKKKEDTGRPLIFQGQEDDDDFLCSSTRPERQGVVHPSALWQHRDPSLKGSFKDAAPEVVTVKLS